MFHQTLPHQCDCEPACPSRLQCGSAPEAGGEVVAEVAAGVDGEADTAAGTAACTEAEAGSAPEVWPRRATSWRMRRMRWRSPGRSGSPSSPSSAGWDGLEAEERPLKTVCVQMSHLQTLRRNL